MEIIEYYESDNKEYWLGQLQKSDWGGGKYLYDLLKEGKLKQLCGEATRVYMLIEGQVLMSFCTLAEQDDVRDLTLSPWIGFVYTFPGFRGNHYSGELLKHAYLTAQSEGKRNIYISTNEVGLYEKYGYTFFEMMKDVGNADSRVYRMEVAARK